MKKAAREQRGWLVSLKKIKLHQLYIALFSFSVPIVGGWAAVSYDPITNTPTFSKLGDLSIYQPPTGSNKPTLTLLLDKSGSMNGTYSFLQDFTDKTIVYESCKFYTSWGSRYCSDDIRRYYNSVNSIPRGEAYTGYSYYTVPGLLGENQQPCVLKSPDANGNFVKDRYADKNNILSEVINNVTLNYCIYNNQKVYDRISNLKNALIKVLSKPQVDEKILMGIGSFGYTNTYGLINVPAKPLNSTQKSDIYNFLKNLDASGGTPTAAAYADAGAYMLGSSTYNGGSTYSGMRNTNNTKIVADNKYIAPEIQQCGAKAVYLLTDGYPSDIGNGLNSIVNMMNQALSITNINSSDDRVDSGASLSKEGWGYILNFSKKLKEKGIKTAMVGFGADFNAVDNASNFVTESKILSLFKDAQDQPYIYQKKYFDCSKLSGDAKNSCNLGSESGKYDKVGGYGEGGFYFAKNDEDIVGSILSVIDNLKTDIPSLPSGTITIPQDPISPTNIQPYAYLPVLEPKVNSNLLIWPGNLKKYQVNQGTLFGKDNQRLYVKLDNNRNPIAGFPADLNPNTQDLWSTQNYTAANDNGQTVNANDKIASGGFYARLKSPSTTDNSTRIVYVESGNSLIKVGVQSGSLIGFDQLDADYDVKAKLYLLNFLGYNVNPSPDIIKKISTASNVQTELAKLITTPTGDIKVLGGILHSQPTLVTYGGKINSANKDDDNDGKPDDDAGQISTKDSDRNDYIMFGSMDGALHLAKSYTGEETVAIIPKAMIKNQVLALKDKQEDSTAPAFGIDAPWTLKGSYNYNYNLDGTGQINAKNMKIYGGLGRGGKGIYGIDVTNISTPTKLFAIDNSSSGFARMGMIWSKPTIGKVKIGNDVKDVLIFGGGYDNCYEDPTFKLNSSSNQFDSCNKPYADGSAVYIVDANDGSLLVSFSADSGANKNINVSSMLHSVVSEITTLDRDNDGLIDHLYFGDLGGQVFRIDLQNGQTFNTTPNINTFVRRVTRVLNTASYKPSNNTLLDDGLQYRFYAKPVVSFYKPEGYTTRLAVVNIASGDRSSPLARNRSIAQSDRVFGIFDRDIARQDLYGKNVDASLVTTELTMDKLADLPFNKSAKDPTQIDASQNRDKVINDMKSGNLQGWSYPLTYFDGYGNVQYVKSMGNGVTIANTYYLTAYSPDMQYDKTLNPCSAQVIGGSERQMYCLPWGICQDESSKNGMGGYIRAGKGIQELTLGAFSKDRTSLQTLIGNQTLAEVLDPNNRIDFGTRDPKLNGQDADLRRDPNGNTNKTSGSNDKQGNIGMGSGNQVVSEVGFKLFSTRWFQKLAE